MPIAAPEWDPNQRARQNADLKYTSAEDQLKRALEQAALTGAANEAGLNQYGVKGREGITGSFDQLDQNLAVNRKRTAEDLGTQANIIGRGYRDANATAEAARKMAAERLSSLAGFAGLSNQAVAEAQTPLENLVAQIVGQNAQMDATRTGNLRNWAAQQDALLGEGQGAAKRDRANRMSSFESDLMKELAGNRQQMGKQQYDLNASLLDLLKERGAYQTTNAQELADMLFGQQLQAGQFNLSEAVAQAESADRAAARSQASQEAGWRQQLAMMEFQKSIEDGDFARAQAIKDQMRADTALNLENSRYNSEQAYRKERDANADDWATLGYIQSDDPEVNKQNAIAAGKMQGPQAGLSGASYRKVNRAGGAIQEAAAKKLGKILTGQGNASTSKWNKGTSKGGQSVGIFGIPTGRIPSKDSKPIWERW